MWTSETTPPALETPAGRAVFRQYRGFEDIAPVATLMAASLSEPYSSFTFRYFAAAWPDLFILAHDAVTGEMIGAVVSKLDLHRRLHDPDPPVRGYIAMLAVVPSWRGHGLGRRLVGISVGQMRNRGAHEAVLETEVTNKGALGLYGGLGFMRDKRLCRYYLSGCDAYRLKLPLVHSATWFAALNLEFLPEPTPNLDAPPSFP